MLAKLPNIITLSRMLFSVLLLAVPTASLPFLLLYLLCGLSDLLDGMLARHLHCVSKTGALLDSIADLLFLLVVLGKLLGSIPLPVWLILWMFLIFIVRVASLIIGFIRYSALALLHTIANKAAGLILFVYPLLCFWDTSFLIAGCLCTVALFAAVEELWLNCHERELKRDKRGIWF